VITTLAALNMILMTGSVMMLIAEAQPKLQLKDGHQQSSKFTILQILAQT